MLVCRDFARLLSETLDHPLEPPQRMRVRFHVVLCGPCRRYGAQISALSALLRAMESRPGFAGPAGPLVELSPEARARILAAIAAATPPAADPETRSDQK